MTTMTTTNSRSMFPCKFFWTLTMLLLISLIPTVQARDIVIDSDRYIIPADHKGPLPPETAQVGDRIIFEWNGIHNVYIHPFGGCSVMFRQYLGDQPGATYTFQPKDAGKDVVFACDIDNHCAEGMIMTVTVLPREEGDDEDQDLDDLASNAFQTLPSTIFLYWVGSLTGILWAFF